MSCRNVTLTLSTPCSKLDLIVRARYQNPIPAPAFPPLLVDIPVSLPLLVGKPDLTSLYAASLPLPMMIDSEIGMPLDLNAFDGIWSGETKSNPHLNPVEQATANGSAKKAALDPEDLALLEAPSRSTIINGVVSSSNFVQAGSLKQTYHKPEVAWLRNTTYLSRDTGKKVGLPSNGAAGASSLARPQEKKEAALMIDASMLAQQQAIEKTFWIHDHTKVEDLRHPLKPHLRAVDVSLPLVEVCPYLKESSNAKCASMTDIRYSAR
jgi:RNA polymerase II-associated factor 1